MTCKWTRRPRRALADEIEKRGENKNIEGLHIRKLSLCKLAGPTSVHLRGVRANSKMLLPKQADFEMRLGKRASAWI